MKMLIGGGAIWSFFILLALAACTSVQATEAVVTPEKTKMSLEEELAEEELAAAVIATARAEKTQIASRVSPYVKISNEEGSYLAFWFAWNDETVFLPLNKVRSADLDLVACQLEPETEIVTGKLLSGWEVLQDTCRVDENASENAPPIIKIPGYFNEGLEITYNHETDARTWNVIDLNGENAENFAEIVTIIAKNDLLASGDLTISVYRVAGPNDELYPDTNVLPTYTLPAQALQLSFSSDQLENFEYVEDVVFALEREFTWEIPTGFSVLNLSPGDENWFMLRIRETKAGDAQEVEYLDEIYIQVKGVGTLANPQ